MGLSQKGFYGQVFFGVEGWGCYILNFGSLSSKFLSKDDVSAGLKMKGYWINWKLHLTRQL